MTTITQILYQLKQTSGLARFVLNKIKAVEEGPHLYVGSAETVEGKPPVRLTEAGILDLLQGDSKISEGLPTGNEERKRVATSVLNHIKCVQGFKDGIFGDFNGAGSVFAYANQQGREVLEEQLAAAAPKLARINLEKARGVLILSSPIVEELLSGDYERFKAFIKPITGGNGTPHEELVSYIFNALNKSQNDQAKREIINTFGDLINKTVDLENDEAVLKWYADLKKMQEQVIGLITEEEKAEILQKLQVASKEEGLALLKLFKEYIDKTSAAELFLPLVGAKAISVGDILGLVPKKEPTPELLEKIRNAGRDPNKEKYLNAVGLYPADAIAVGYDMYPIRTINKVFCRVNDPAFQQHLQALNLTRQEIVQRDNEYIPYVSKKLCAAAQDPTKHEHLQALGIELAELSPENIEPFVYPIEILVDAANDPEREQFVQALGLTKEELVDLTPQTNPKDLALGYLRGVSQDPRIAEYLKVVGLTSEDLQCAITNGPSINLALKAFIGFVQTPIGQKQLEEFGITAEELKAFHATGKPPATLLKKLVLLASAPKFAKYLKAVGINPAMVKLLPFIFGDKSNIGDLLGSILTPSSEAKGSGLADFIEGAQEALKDLGIKLPEELTAQQGSTNSSQGTTPSPGWANGYGKYIVGGLFGALGVVGLFVEDNIVKTFLVALGTLGIGGTIAANSQSVGKMLGAPTRT